MPRLQKIFRIFSALARQPRLLSRILDDNAHWERRVKRHYGTDHFPVLALAEYFPALREQGVTVSPYAFLEGGSLPTDLALLRLLARSIPHCRYFEIGTWRGESLMNVLAEGAEGHTLNLSDAQMLQRGYTPEALPQVGILIPPDAGVKVYREDSAAFDFSLPGGKFDLIFIDGDHHYESVKRDTEQVIRHLCHERSVVCWHDYAFHPEAIRHEVMAGILDALPQALHPRLVHFSHTKMAVLLPDPPPGQAFSLVQSPDPAFRLDIRAAQ
ncbi:MAG TPA: class I SAM-dependent methyltransferase [Bacteroidales bacterium]|nr:class I SAM-dependent methyltransferase [Bacteroidales bacterium]